MFTRSHPKPSHASRLYSRLFVTRRVSRKSSRQTLSSVSSLPNHFYSPSPRHSCCHTNPHSSSRQKRVFSFSSSDPPAIDKSDDDTDSAIPGAQTGGKKLAIVFTCTVCGTRSAKQFSENAYRNGVVVVQCPGCQNRHLIADNLGFFADQSDGGWNVEKAMAKMGDNLKLVNDDNVLEVSVEDVVGSDAMEAARGDASTASSSSSTKQG